MRLGKAVAVAVVVVVLITTLGVPTPAGAAVIDPGTTAPYALVIGDSITHAGMHELHGLRPKWVIDGLDGRNVDTIPTLIQQWTKRKGKQPRYLVVALGTNFRDATWQPWSYRKIRVMLPNTRIIFVTPYRGPSSPDPYATYRTGRYADGMRQAAATQYGVCVAEWRMLVEQDPTLLADGVHPTRPAQKTWASLVSQAFRECVAS